MCCHGKIRKLFPLPLIWRSDKLQSLNCDNIIFVIFTIFLVETTGLCPLKTIVLQNKPSAAQYFTSPSKQMLNLINTHGYLHLMEVNLGKVLSLLDELYHAKGAAYGICRDVACKKGFFFFY